MQPGQYRIRLSCDLCRAIVFPSVSLWVALKFLGIHLGPILFLPAYFVFLVLWAVVKRTLENLRHARTAQQLGAQPIRRVVGKWPGNIDILLRMVKAFKTSYVLDVYLQLFEEYQCTTLNTRILWVDHVITMDQQHSKFVLSTGFGHFWRGHSQKERMETFLGEGIFNRDDEMWKMHRNVARPFFARERISDFDLFDVYARRTLNLISSLTASGQPCEVQDLFSRFTLDAASEFLFGTDLKTLSASLPVPGKTAMGPKGSATDDSWGAFAKSFEMAQQIITDRGRIGYLWPLFELFKDKNEANAAVIQAWLDPLVRRAVEDKRRAEKAGIASPVAEKTFMQHLADSTDDPVLIRDQLLSVLLASRDTTACLLTFITYFMAIYPDMARKLRAEVLEHCGPHGAPTYENIRDMKYMRAVINEVLRLYPPVPLNVRESRAEACTLPPSDSSYANDDPRPFYMPGGTTIMYLPLLMQRNPVLWGPDADIFDPERWLHPDRISKFVANPTMYAPFSAGPRICLGQNYAYNEASYFLVRLLQEFDTFTLAPEFQPAGSLPPPEWKSRKGRQAIEKIWPAAALTLYIKGGLWVRFGKTEGLA
ncbi:cytochrome P450 monooxygenase CYP63 [Mycena albidolilacea]|uniref:Cytochrome P450 monooxygenase CYP63 n=1 Tax=Mycena albidolilacea TaxID=1033008 RepID=A0AAD6ZFM6_9AGAR|nr:cytochrome P450 monooxygenase CYP63 [Mycena albidolilacea]